MLTVYVLEHASVDTVSIASCIHNWLCLYASTNISFCSSSDALATIEPVVPMPIYAEVPLDHLSHHNLVVCEEMR